ncbi:ribose-5-phosphate isomerase [Candidatus Peregrinibacteria bacterium CG11_big_fil_rev_8_21_14_0_20_41_10]|nr:MAG: ribose-5-phosphate isomerase [Candidatus Peregrinibacteria bacterium CG11_big_fil_rev_8_21_14_0_20_41_10]PIZ73045.1 MAG: ribose-5-phosphate isomerase [Candidatus Peregrinibacteria bacterium CG_4_10_14_0_2_um_filter_41_8]PJC38082.1 MAG: ribose-5-phosphate isomerase [Candidatus Peregrinibacteria bacterium CG_4_9_14_0_2_um_filter_41_14]
MKIFLGTDHAGFELKEIVKKFLEMAGHEVHDMGALTYDELDDYPDFIIPAAEAVGKDPENTRGIVFGGSGQGEAIAANKVKGVRAALYYGHNLEIVRLSREHNNSNVLSLGARMQTPEEAKEAVQLWLDTKFAGDRHQRRIDKISQFEG